MEVSDEQITQLITIVLPVAAEVKKEKRQRGKTVYGSFECPLCKGELKYSISGYNGHMSGKCGGCWVEWIE